MSEIDTKQEPYRLNDAELDRLAEKPVLGAELAADRLRWTEAEITRLRAENAALRSDLIVAKARVAAMQRDLAGKTRERDKARRESCVLESMLRFSKTHPKETVSKVVILRLAQEIAVEMEWDCFPEKEER
jgi:hypothetical protein